MGGMNMNDLSLRVTYARESLVPKETYQWQSLGANLQQSPAKFLELQRRYNDQAAYLKTLSNKLALLEDQLKQMEYADTVAGNCKQCLGKSLNLCGQCVVHMGGYIVTKSEHIRGFSYTQKHFLDLDKGSDIGQEDAYWL